MFTELARRWTGGRRGDESPWLAALDALATPHGVDRYLEWLRPTWTLREVRALVTRVERPTPQHLTLHLRPNAAFRGFEAGQHVALSVEIDGVRHTRCYSPVSSAVDWRPGSTRDLELTVSIHADGKVSPWLRDHVQTGRVLDLSPARGDFVLPSPRPEQILLISAGSGITPVLSMLRTLCDEGYEGAVTFLHYARSRDAMPYADELQRLAERHPNVNVSLVFSQEPERGNLPGRFGEEQLCAAMPAWRAAEAFVCGPEGLMDAARSLFEAQGLTDRLHTESFEPIRYRVDAHSAGARVVFARSGVEIVSDGRSLLEQAEAAGLSPAHGCRRGICHTCVCRMTAGTVRNVLTGDTLTGTDVDVQPCIQAPVGDIRIEL